MGITKRMLALMMVVVMCFGSVLCVSAAGSPTGGNTPYLDKNTKDHNKKTTVTSKVTSKAATVIKAEAGKSKGVLFSIARDKNGKAVNITVIGDGKKGVFNNKKGKKITAAKIGSKAKKVIVKKLAFKGSKVKKLTVTSKKVQIDKNAFKGTKAKTLTLKVKKASQLTLKKGCFKGLKKIIIKGAKKAQKKKIKKALKKAGFKGKIK